MRHPVRTVSTSICRRARRTLMQDEVSSADSVTNGRPIHNRNPEAGNPRQCWLWLGERSRAQQRKTAAERREVLRNGVVWRCSAHEATGRNRANTGAQGKKIPTDKGWDFGFWWRNAEPNPRPTPEPDRNAWALRAWIRRFGRLVTQRGGSVRAISLQPWSNVNVRAWPTGF